METTPTFHYHTTNKLQSWINERHLIYTPAVNHTSMPHSHQYMQPRKRYCLHKKYYSNPTHSIPHIQYHWPPLDHHSQTKTKMAWEQYQTNLEKPQHFEPPTQPFETEVARLYQRYKYKTSKNDPLKLSQHTLLKAILEHLIDSHQIIHSYFKQFYSPFSRDSVWINRHNVPVQMAKTGICPPTHRKRSTTSPSLGMTRIQK